jgi:6-phospho-3-hexuloisomerase
LEKATKHILQRIGETLDDSQSTEINELIEGILSAKKVFVYGVGRSGIVARAFSIRLVQIGLKVFYIGETITPIVENDDLVIIVSNTGETMSAIQTANIVRRLGARVIAITAKKQSKLAHASNVIIHLNVQKNEKDKELAPLGTIFEDTALILLDGMVYELMKRVGETENKMRARHAIWV